MTSGDISADFPGHAVNHITEELGNVVTPLFAQGCGANINGFPVSFSIESGWHERAEEAGRKLGRGVLEAMRNKHRDQYRQVKGAIHPSYTPHPRATLNGSLAAGMRASQDSLASRI